MIFVEWTQAGEDRAVAGELDAARFGQALERNFVLEAFDDLLGNAGQPVSFLALQAQTLSSGFRGK